MLAIGTKSLQDSHLITLILPCSCSLVDSRPRILHSALVSCWCDCCGCCCGCYCGCCYFGSLAAAVGPPAAGFFQVFSDLACPRHVSDVQISIQALSPFKTWSTSLPCLPVAVPLGRDDGEEEAQQQEVQQQLHGARSLAIQAHNSV